MNETKGKQTETEQRNSENRKTNHLACFKWRDYVNLK